MNAEPGTHVDHAQAVEIRLVLEPGDPIRGRIEPAESRALEFRGWMDLISAINRLRGTSH